MDREISFVADPSQWTLTCSGLQLAKELDSLEDIVRVIVMEVVDSEGLPLPSQVLRESWRAT